MYDAGAGVGFKIYHDGKVVRSQKSEVGRQMGIDGEPQRGRMFIVQGRIKFPKLRRSGM
jgi:hypothetical protein